MFSFHPVHPLSSFDKTATGLPQTLCAEAWEYQEGGESEIGLSGGSCRIMIFRSERILTQAYHLNILHRHFPSNHLRIFCSTIGLEWLGPTSLLSKELLYLYVYHSFQPVVFVVDSYVLKGAFPSHPTGALTR